MPGLLSALRWAPRRRWTTPASPRPGPGQLGVCPPGGIVAVGVDGAASWEPNSSWGGVVMPAAGSG